MKIESVRSPAIEGCLSVGDSVPLTFNLFADPQPDPLYRTIREGVTSLVELKFDRLTQRAIEVILVLFQHFTTEAVPPAYRECLAEEGWIRLAITEEQMPQLSDEFCKILVYLEEYAVFVLVNGVTSPRRLIQHGRMGFFECNGELCGLKFSDLTDPEVKSLQIWR